MKPGLREATQQFSKAIKAVRAGKEVVLTERGRAIAVIKPIKAEHAQEAALQRCGHICHEDPAGSQARQVELERYVA